jgi:hypothetical protein
MIMTVALLTACTILIARWSLLMATTTAENIRKGRADIRRKRILLKLDHKWEWRNVPPRWRPSVA